MKGTVRASVEVSTSPKAAFDGLVDEIELSMANRGLHLDKRSAGGRVFEGEVEVGLIEKWIPHKTIEILWRPKSWEKGADSAELVISLVPVHRGTRVSIEQRGWGRVLGTDGEELLGWFADEVGGSLVSSCSPSKLGDWITDRRARRPSGRQSRDVYRNPVYHWPNFMAILEVLALRPTDNLLEVGCGGGAFLHEALKSGCRASAIDHSLDMVKLAKETNRLSVAKGRLSISHGEADTLSFAGGTFTCAVMTGVFNFLADPLRALTEVHRVLTEKGRLVVFAGSKDLRGTPAAPEPMASRLCFYEDRELAGLAREAGFGVVKVEHPSLYEKARKAGVPEADLILFKGTRGSQLLVARKV